MDKSALFTSNSDEWATPQWLFDELNEEFNFTLDPCATNENHKVSNYFTKESNGLAISWGVRKFFAIHLTVKLINGLKRHSEKQERITHWWFY